VNPGHLFREVRDLGFRRAFFRLSWEARMRSGAMSLLSPAPPPYEPERLDGALARSLPFAEPGEVRDTAALPAGEVEALRRLAAAAARGRLRCFSRWDADFGDPIDWHRDPLSGARWPRGVHWSRIPLGAGGDDVKFIWEAARFPQAFVLARAAAHDPERAGDYGAALLAQIDSFIENNPFGRGVHWASGYEIALRSIAWIFGMHVFRDAWDAAAQERVWRAVHANAVHVAAYFDFARYSCFNDHLIGEALLLFIAGRLFRVAEWVGRGREVLDAEADVQIYPDGAYLLASHTYHRAVVQLYALAVVFGGAREPWRNALARSIDFLAAQQNPGDGRLPNFGSNDGGVPFPASGADYADFRPAMQAASAVARGERFYAPGIWDEEMLWLAGAQGRALPLHPPALVSRSFEPSGYHVLRGNDPSNFAVFRCGAVRSRFPQIDMLHLDVWWRGRNVLADGGTYRYNGAPEWHEHFVRTASHNTVSVDGEDQMLHHRPFKVLYWTDARLLHFESNARFDLAAGEHYGYRRIAPGCTHRRSVLFCKDELWIVADSIVGEGAHDLRLHWLCGDEGFSVAVFDAGGNPLETSVVAGAASPPRGWISRYYGEKTAVPSIAVERRAALPFVFVSVLAPETPPVSIAGDRWSVGGITFALRDGTIGDVQ